MFVEREVVAWRVLVVNKQVENVQKSVDQESNTRDAKKQLLEPLTQTTCCEKP